MLTQTQINKLNKAKENEKGIVLKLSQKQTGGSIFILARAALPLVGKALGLAGLSFGAEKALKKIFGSGIPQNAIELAKLTDKLSPDQKRGMSNALKQQGVSGSGQRGGFLGLLASFGIPLTISLVKKVLGKGIRIQPTGGRGMRLEPPPVFGSWKKKIRGYTFE